jgi:hypothetical protein
VGNCRLQVGITRAAPIVLDGPYVGDELSSRAGILTGSDVGWTASKSPAINAQLTPT